MALKVPLSSLTSLDVTHVLYDGTSYVSLALALLTLTPILLNPAYAALSVQTRELVFLEMWAGQMLCEAFNWVLKHIIKQERPNHGFGFGYAFPSSHSQWMGYFAAFLICHFAFRHRFVSTGWAVLDWARLTVLYSGIIAWACAVAYSRYYLRYHSPSQVIWGLGIGALFGVSYYTIVELIPMYAPQSFLGRIRAALLENPLCTWFRIRDGWAVWGDGGTEEQWLQWKAQWEKRYLGQRSRVKKTS